jgi:hypothetical protein
MEANSKPYIFLTGGYIYDSVRILHLYSPTDLREFGVTIFCTYYLTE